MGSPQAFRRTLELRAIAEPAQGIETHLFLLMGDVLSLHLRPIAFYGLGAGISVGCPVCCIAAA